MNIQELQSERDALQIRLLNLIQFELEQFRKDTGVGVEGISVYFADLQELGKPKSDYCVDKVQVYLDI